VIELGYDSEPDEFGVHDGRSLARQLVADAYRLLIPYVNACPACAGELLRTISDQVAREISDKGMTSIVFWDARRGLDKATAAATHQRMAQAKTAEMLVGAPKHEHRVARTMSQA
jgi:hypothetical protein